MKNLLIIALLLIILWLVVNRQSSGYTSIGDTLSFGQVLRSDQALVSSNGTYKAVMQADGNFVVLNGSNNKIWETGSKIGQNDAGTLSVKLNANGALELVNGTMTSIGNYSPPVQMGPRWNLIMKPGGNLAISAMVHGQEKIPWTTQTAGK